MNEIGAGLAYSTKNDAHILNVTASKMGIDEGSPDSFYLWLSRRSPAFSPGDFVPRHLYREYLASELAEATNRLQLKLAREHVVSSRVLSDSSHELTTQDDAKYRVKHVVIAIGNSPSARGQAIATESAYRSPWKLVLLQISFFTSSITSFPHLVTLLSRKILAILQYCCGFPPSEACQSGATLRAIREKTYLAKH